jgi:hypothetical protein
LITRPPPPPDHDPQRLAPDQECAAQIDADHPVEILGRGFEQWLLDQDASVVDQDVEPAAAGKRGLHHLRHLALVGYISLHGESEAARGADLGDHRFDLRCRRAVHHSHLRPVRRERQGDRSPNAARSARHQSAPALERAHHAITSPRSTP